MISNRKYEFYIFGGDADVSRWIAAVTNRATTRAQLLSCLHQSIVECITLQQMGESPQIACSLHNQQDQYDMIFTRNIQVSETGSVFGIEHHSAEEQETFEDVMQSATASSTTDSHVANAFRTGNTETAGSDPIARAFEESIAEGGREVEVQDEIEPRATTHVQPAYFQVPSETFLNARLDFANPTTFSV